TALALRPTAASAGTASARSRLAKSTVVKTWTLFKQREIRQLRSGKVAMFGVSLFGRKRTQGTPWYDAMRLTWDALISERHVTVNGKPTTEYFIHDATSGKLQNRDQQ